MAGTVRPPAVAGRFYPGVPDTLARRVDAMIDDVPAADEPLAPAYVVPHAGHRFSGPTAAHVYTRLRAHADEIDRVVLIGPAHFVRLSGCAVPTADRWASPLGEVEVHVDGAGALVTAGHAVADDAPHAPEHCLEVQLPFLQRVLPGARVLPVAAGPTPTDAVADLLDVTRAERTVLLCSTDLSHYHDDATARELDKATIGAVLDLDPERIGPRDACGVFGLRGLTRLAGRLGWTPRLLDYSTSADTAGTPDRVVGYAALALS